MNLELYKAYKKCRCRKRNTKSVAIFEYNLEHNLSKLEDEIVSGYYKPLPMSVFIVKKPKMREIFAAEFKDRIVHQFLINRIEPKWENLFIYDSYACIKGKGTHLAVKRLQTFLRKATKNNTKKAFFLQLDIKGFFNSISKDILYNIIKQKIKEGLTLSMIKTIIFQDFIKDCIIKKAKKDDFMKLPPHKTLFKTPKGKGLPIGNLTSQFFANVYLNELDQFVKHTLKAKFYIRYCDDFVIISEDKNKLKKFQNKIKLFLKNKLDLLLNNNVTTIGQVSTGIDFLGYIVKPKYTLARKRVVATFKLKLKEIDKIFKKMGYSHYQNGRVVLPKNILLEEKTAQIINSYLAHFKHASTYSLIQNFKLQYPWILIYFRWRALKSVVLKIKPPDFIIDFFDIICYYSKKMVNYIIVVYDLDNKSLICFYNNKIIFDNKFSKPDLFLKNNLPKIEAFENLWNSDFKVAFFFKSQNLFSNITYLNQVAIWE